MSQYRSAIGSFAARACTLIPWQPYFWKRPAEGTRRRTYDSNRPDRDDDGEKENIPQDQEVNEEYKIHDDEENYVEKNVKENDYQEHKCKICEKTFREKRRLVDHMTNVHSGKDCSLWIKLFSNKKNFNRHIRAVYRRHGKNTMCTKHGKIMSCKE